MKLASPVLRSHGTNDKSANHRVQVRFGSIDGPVIFTTCITFFFSSFRFQSSPLGN